MQRIEVNAQTGERKVIDLTPEEIAERLSRQEAPEAVMQRFSQAVQDMLDAAARAHGYDNIHTAVSYAEEPAVEKFQTEGQAFRAWRSRVWAYCYAQLDAVMQGQRPQPGIEEFLGELPQLELGA